MLRRSQSNHRRSQAVDEDAAQTSRELMKDFQELISDDFPISTLRNTKWLELCAGVSNVMQAKSKPDSSSLEYLAQRCETKQLPAKTAAALKRVQDLEEQGILDVDPRALQTTVSRPKTVVSFWESFKREQQWILKEQTMLERWQRKMARKRAADAVKRVNEFNQSDSIQKAKEETFKKKGAAKIASMVQEFWYKVNRITLYYELQLLEDVKQKKLESQLLNVIDRSSTLTQIMIPGAKKTNEKTKKTELSDLLDEPDDMDAFLASLPPEYLASYTAGGIVSEDDHDEPIKEQNSIVPRRSSSKSPIKVNGFQDSEAPLKENGYGQKRRSQRLSMSPPIAKKARLELENDMEVDKTPDTVTIPHETSDETIHSLNNEATDESVAPTPQPASTDLHDVEMKELAKTAEAFLPTGSTYETAKVRTEVPSILNAKLREYQHIGLDWLTSLFENKLNGILADEMGLGKTVQTIAFLAHLAENKQIWGPHLIVVPTSVLLNWEREFKRFCPSLKVLTYFGSTKDRKEKRKGWKKPNSFNVCITSYDLYIRDTRMFKWRAWQCLVLDEAHNIKNSKSLRWNKLLSLRTRIRLLLTGTPLQNNLMELWSLLYFLMPSVFGSQEDFKNWFNDPMNAMAEGAAEYNSHIVEKLHTVIRPFILRRLKSEVEKQMPLKLERVIYCPLARIQRNMYNQFIRQKSTIDSIRGGSAISVMNIVMQLRKCCNHPNLFYPISCTAPTALPQLSLPFPNIISESYKEDEALTFLRILKSDFIDEKDQVLPLISSIFFKTSDRPAIKTIVNSRRLKEQTAIPKLILKIDEKKASIEFVSKKMQWLWNVTKPIRDDIYVRHDAVDSNLFEPAARSFRNLHHKLVRKFAFPTYPVYAFPPKCTLASTVDPVQETVCNRLLENEDELVSHIHYSVPIQYPDPKLVELDCGKLRMLAKLLRELKQGGHRCLIFTQMSKMLDILEIFLSHQKYPYFRLDGSTNIQQRQVLMDRFNADDRVFVFILSTRSGGIGMNLTGADTVIFYDSDWNPTMDAQAQDRCHRIGQTRNVVIYRLISSHSIEENILKKATHKRRLGEMTLDEGEFNSKFGEKSDVRELFEGEEALQDVLVDCDLTLNTKDVEKAMFSVEDKNDVQAAQELRKEIGADDEPETGAPEDVKEALIAQLTPIERYAFKVYLDEKQPDIDDRLKHFAGTLSENGTEAGGSDDEDEELDSDDDETEKSSSRSTPIPPPPKSIRRAPKRALKGSAVESPATKRSKRVRFSGVAG